MHKNCLNCNTHLQGEYCHRCGQKASTHRITLSKFIKHDLLHGVLHLDKGILYTLKNLVFNPGYTIRSFLAGKRVMHYNIFALFIIVIAIKTLIDYHISDGDMFNSLKNKDTDVRINEAVDHYYKFFYLLSIPLLSIFSYLFSKRLHYNYTEHIVFNCFLLTGGFFYALIFSLFCFLTGLRDNQPVGILFVALYIMLGYYQATSETYTFRGYLWRILAILLTFVASLIIVLMLIIIFAYGGSFEGSILL